MVEFHSWNSYHEFARSVINRWRFARTNEQSEFIAAVLGTAPKRYQVIPSGSNLWRAQLGCDVNMERDDEGESEYPCPLPPSRMKPLTGRAREGRANPKGIPYLYLATHKETALAEVRPWIGSSVSVGSFELTRDIRIVNTVTDGKSILYFKEPDPEVREMEVWRSMDRAFAQPVTVSDELAEYAPTQVLAEVFRMEGLDGIAYRSSLGPGHNLVLFDIEIASIKGCSLEEIYAIKFKFDMAANPYVISEGKGRRDASNIPQRSGD
jgi:hypothetical protein